MSCLEMNRRQKWLWNSVLASNVAVKSKGKCFEKRRDQDFLKQKLSQETALKQGKNESEQIDTDQSK